MAAIDESKNNKIVSCVYVCTPNHGRWPLMSDEMASYYGTFRPVNVDGLKHPLV
jgi:hypothetical protein